MNRKIIEQDLENIYCRNIPWEDLQSKTVLISGAYGMLASYFIYMLIYLNERYQMDIKILALIRSEKKLLDRFQEYVHRPYFFYHTCSLDKPVLLDEDIDYVVHAASLASPQYYGVCPVDVLKPNVIGTYHLLELAKEKKAKGFLLFSTGDVYGKVADIDQISETDMGKLDPLDIHNCYSESKRMAETMCYAYFKQHNIPVKILRIWHTYSPTMDLKGDPRVFASFMNNLVKGEDIVMQSDGNGKRSFCYITDAIAAYYLVMLRGKAGEAYNICSNEFYSIRELAEIILAIRPDLNLKVIQKKRNPQDSYIENAVAAPIRPDHTKLKALGWAPQFSVTDGFKRVYESFK